MNNSFFSADNHESHGKDRRIMKKLMALLMMVFVLAFTTSCDIEESHDPIKTFLDYMTAYENLDFEEMYALLDQGSKDAISEEEYLNLYHMIYDGIPITEAKMEPRMDTVEIEQKVKGKEDARIPINFRMVKAGEEVTYSIDVTLKKEIDEEDHLNYKVVFTKELVYNEYDRGDTIETKEVAPVRGEIFDRNNKPLAMNGEILWVGMVSGKLGAQESSAITALSQTFSLSEEVIVKKLNQKWVKDNMFVDMLKAPMDRKADLDNLIAQYPGITYRVITGRVYPYEEAAAHLTGYLGLISEEEFEELKPLGFPIDTMVGRSGLELIYEERLRGQLGTETFLMSKEGLVKEKLTTFQMNKGEDLFLTIDIDEQVKLYDVLAGEPGTASHVDYKTGEVHALVSSPAYDPNTFVFGHSKDSYNTLLEDGNKPLVNRFTKLYSPGSTIKPLVAAIAIDRMNYDETRLLDVPGKTWQKDSTWGNYFVTRVTDPGKPLNLDDAMVYSDNIYFARMALELGGETLIKGMKDFGVGEPLNLGFPFEKDQISTEDNLDNDILLADTGYGQGEVLFHSMTLPGAFTAIADEGNRKSLNLFRDEEKKTFSIIDKDTADQVFQLMNKVIEDPEGTGHLAFIEGRNLGGKTGTAEIGSGTNRQEIGWFTVIEKSDEQPFITTIMLENTKDRGGSLMSVEKMRDYLIQ